MKRFIAFSTILALVAMILSCTKGAVNGNDSDKNSKNSYTIKFSDTVIGVNQWIELTTNYTSDNPNILVTWFDNDERCNRLARTHTTYLWTPEKAGDHTIKCSITDREEIIEFEASVKVVECDYDKAIIGDSKDKIIRTYNDPRYDTGNTIGYGWGRDDVREFTFSGNNLSKIHFEEHTQWPTVNQYPHLGLLSMYEEQVTELSRKYGKPSSQSNLGSTQAEKEANAKSIYNSGAMYADWKYNGCTINLMAARSSVYTPGFYWEIEVK